MIGRDRFQTAIVLFASLLGLSQQAFAQGLTDLSLPARPQAPLTTAVGKTNTPVKPAGASRATHPAGERLVEPALMKALIRPTITLIAGASGETSLAAAHDLADVLETSGSTTRLIPMAGRGGIQNAADLLHMKGIDLALIPTDVLAHLTTSDRLGADFPARVRTIARLFHEELHILAGSEIGSLADLAGRKVNIGPHDSATAFTAERVLKALGIEIEPVRLSHQQALAALTSGTIAAMALVSGKPAPLFAEVAAGARGLHLLPIPYTAALEADYLPSRLAPADYPGLVTAQQRVDTIAVGSFVVGYNWPDGHKRKAGTTGFAEALAESLRVLRAAPRHPKWDEASPTANLHGFASLPPPHSPAPPVILSATGDARARAIIEDLAPGNPTEQQRLIGILSGADLGGRQ